MTRYVYWRKSDGRRSTSGHCPVSANLAKAIGSAKVNREGKIEWPFSYFEQETSIRSCVYVRKPDGRELNSTDTSAIASRAIHEIVRNPKADNSDLSDRLIKVADQYAKSLFRTRRQKYTLVTSLSVESFPFKVSAMDGIYIVPSPIRYNRHYRIPDILKSPLREVAFRNHLDETQYSAVRVHLETFSEADAIDSGLDTINTVRGLWNLFATYGKMTIQMGGHKKPICLIGIGPIHTLHHSGGDPVSDDQYWFEPDYRRDIQLFRPTCSWTTSPWRATGFLPLATSLMASRSSYSLRCSLHEHGLTQIGWRWSAACRSHLMPSLLRVLSRPPAQHCRT